MPGSAEPRPGVSIVVPSFNERDSLSVLSAEIARAMGETDRSYEVLFVDDGSRDGSLEVLKELAARDDRIRILRLESNSGQSAALVAGFRAARADVIVTLDADLQNDPADIPGLLRELEGWDMVSGVRTERQDNWRRRAASRIANGFRRWITGDPTTDVGCSLKAYRAEFLQGIPTFDGMHRFFPTLLQMEGARVREIPVRHRPRRFGRAKYNIRGRLWRGLVDLAVVRWMQGRWIPRRSTQEVEVCVPRRFGSASASQDRPSSSPDSSCSGSPPRSEDRA